MSGRWSRTPPDRRETETAENAKSAKRGERERSEATDGRERAGACAPDRAANVRELWGAAKRHKRRKERGGPQKGAGGAKRENWSETAENAERKEGETGSHRGSHSASNSGLKIASLLTSSMPHGFVRS